MQLNNNDDQELQQQLNALEHVAKNYLTREAIQRYGNIKAVYPQKAATLLVSIAQMIDQGQIKQKLTDNQLKMMLSQMTSPKKTFNIRKV